MATPVQLPDPTQHESAANSMAAISSEPIVPVTPQVPQSIPDMSSAMPQLGGIPGMGGGGGEGESVEEMIARLHKYSTSGKPQHGGTGIYPASEVTSERYPYMLPGANNEDLFGAGQSSYSKAFNGLVKGVALTGSTFINSTAGLVDGLFEWGVTGKFSSMWDNITTQTMDDMNSRLENTLPNFYTAKETNAAWYSPTSLLTANFVFDKFVKNLGFVAGAILAGGAYSSVFKALGLGAEISAAGKLAEAAAASEKAMVAGEGVGGLISRLSTIKTTSNILDKTNRVLTAGLATTGEAAMEALGAANEYRSKAIETYRDENNGEMPDAFVMNQIDKEAESVGNTAMQLNMALLTATNYIQFPKVLNTSWSAAKSVDNAIAKNVTVDATGQWAMKEGPKSFFGKAFRAGRRGVGAVFSPSESFEEISQYAIETGTQNYFNKKHRGEDTDFLRDLVGAGYEEAINSKEGMESFLLGGLSGGIVEGISQRGTRRRELGRAQAAVADVNSRRSLPSLLSSGITQDRIESLNRATTLGEELKVAIRNGDQKTSRDLMYDDLHNTLSTRIKYGAYDQVKDEISRYQKLATTPEGFNQLQSEGIANQTDTQESFLARTNYILEEARNIKTLHEGLSLKYGGILNEQGKQRYTPYVIDQLTYAASKIKNIDGRTDSLSNELMDLGIIATPAIEEAFVTGKIEILEALINSNPRLTPEEKDEAREKLIDLSQLYVDRQTYAKDYEDIKANPEKYDRAVDFGPLTTPTEEKPVEKTEEEEVDPNAPPAPDTEPGTNKIKPEDLEVNKRYYITTKAGTTPDSFTILSKNADGSVTVKDSRTGRTMTLSGKLLQSLSLVPVNATGTKTEEFFLRHAGDEYEMDMAGQPIKGSLSYDPDSNVLSFTYQDTKGDVQNIQLSDFEFIQQRGFTAPFLRNTTSPSLSEEDIALLAAMTEEQRAGGVNQVLIRRDRLANGVDNVLKNMEKADKRTSQIRLTMAEMEESLTNNTLSPKELSKLVKQKNALELELAELEASKVKMDLYLENLLAIQRDLSSYPQDVQELMEFLQSKLEDLQDKSEQLTESISTLHKALKAINSLITRAINAIRKAFDRFNRLNPDTLSLEDTELGFALATLPQAGYAEFLQESATYGEDLAALTESVEGLNTQKLNPSRIEREKILKDLKEVQAILPKVEAEFTVVNEFLSTFLNDIEAAEEKRRQAEARNTPEFQEALEVSQKAAEANNGVSIMSPEELVAEEISFDSKQEKSAFSDPYRKPLDVLFGSTTQTTEGENDAHQQFLAKLNNHPNRNNIRRVAVSYNNQEAAGLKGLIPDTHPYSPQSIAKDPKKKDFEIIYVVYQERDLKTRELFYLDSNGDRIVNPEENIDKVVRGVLTSAELFWSGKYGNGPRFSQGSSEEARIFSARWQQVRNFITSQTKKLPSHKFYISRGISIKGPAKQYITKSLISEQDLYAGVVKVVTRDTLIHQDRTVPLKPGSVMIQHGATLEYANSRNLNEREVNLVYKLLLEYAKRASPTTDENERVVQGTLDPQINQFLWGILYFQTPYQKDQAGEPITLPVSKNQFYLNQGKIYFGQDKNGILFDPDVMSDPANAVIIKSFLKQAYHNVNKSYADKNKEFNEILDINTDGSFKTRKWPTYQHYLVSSVYPDGSSRPISELPLSTRVVPNDNVKSRYSYSNALMKMPDIPLEAPLKTTPTPKRPQPTNQAPTVQPPSPKATIFTKEFPSSGTKVDYILTDGKVVVVSEPKDMQPGHGIMLDMVKASYLDAINAQREKIKEATYATLEDVPQAEKPTDAELETQATSALEIRIQADLEKEAQEAAAQAANLVSSAYEAFINTGMVDDATLQVLADKRIAGEAFTMEETAMAAGEVPVAVKKTLGVSYWNQAIDNIIKGRGTQPATGLDAVGAVFEAIRTITTETNAAEFNKLWDAVSPEDKAKYGLDESSRGTLMAYGKNIVDFIGYKTYQKNLQPAVSTGLVGMPEEKNGEWIVEHDSLNNYELNTYIATVANKHGNTETFIPDYYKFPTKGLALAFVKEVNSNPSGSTIGAATAAYLDRSNEIYNIQKVKLVDLINNGTITFTDENGDLC